MESIEQDGKSYVINPIAFYSKVNESVDKGRTVLARLLLYLIRMLWSVWVENCTEEAQGKAFNRLYSTEGE